MIRTLSLSKAEAVAGKCGFLYKPLVFFLSIFLSVANTVLAQAPTALQYPASSNFTAHVSSVYLVPTLSGSTTGLSFSISPALPAGLSLNTTTGVISGVPTSASTASYIVTATNSYGSTVASLDISTTNSYYNNANGPLSFLDAKRTFKIGNGQNVGDIAVYSNVTTLGGQAIDCIVKTVGVTNVSSWNSYDQAANAGTGFNSNDDKYFSPQVVFGNGGGSVIFEFQFILGGSYNNTTKSGTNVTLQGVMLNTYDIDGNGNSGSNQYNEFDGFSKVELSSATTINSPTYDATAGLTKFLSNTSANSQQVTDDDTRVRLTYDNMSLFHIQVGANAAGLAYFFLDFSGGPAFATAVSTYPPTIDLNISLPGTANGSSGCANALTFTSSGQTNITSPTAITELIISYENTTANLPNGSAEKLIINGATAGTSSHALNFTTAGTSSVTVGGVTYTISKSVSGTTNTIEFYTATTFTVAQAETLIDALQYDNTLSMPTSGSRIFTVSIRNTKFVSPDAIFTATLNCVTISGNVYHDANALTDNTVNANGTMGQFAASGLYVVLTNAATNTVLATVPIAAGGAYTFGRQDPGTYNLFISNTATPGASMTTSTYPVGNYKSTGENLGATAGNDGLVDSKMTVMLGTVAITNANLGIQIPPVTTDYTASNKFNPGGFNYFSIPSSYFITSDADGTVQTFTITSFPTGANYLKIGSTFYTNGGTCPPQVSCTAWPGTITLPISATNTLAVDPASPGNTTVVLPYTVLDNGNFRSNNNVPSNITIPFVVETPPVNISGYVWNDANGNGVQEPGEAYTAAASAGETLYALLLQNTNTYSGAATILASTAVSATTGYSFANVPSGNNYEVRIASLAAAPVDGAAKTTVTPALAINYTGVSTDNNGVAAPYQNTNNLVNALGVVNATKTNVNFGIDRIPNTYLQNTTIPVPAVNSFLPLSGGSNPPVLIGSDAEDQPSAGSLGGKKVAITTLPAYGQLWYNGVQITKGNDNTNVPSFSNPFILPNYDPTKLQMKFTGSGYTMITFNYAYIDAAGIIDPSPAPYILSWLNALPVQLVSFSGKKNGAAANLQWTTVNETGLQAYELERSTDGISFKTIATITAKGAANNEYAYEDKLNSLKSAGVYYRLKAVSNDGKVVYSQVVFLKLAEEKITVTVSPNPVSGPLTVTINSDRNGEAVLRLLAYNGKTVLAKTIGISAGATNIRLDGEKPLANGVYLVAIAVNGSLQTQSFVVQH